MTNIIKCQARIIVPDASGRRRIDCTNNRPYDGHHDVLLGKAFPGDPLIMPWPKEHKRNTRERIVAAAAAAFRQQGIDQVSVADIMRRAGLTHGGFYAHFTSKEDLVAAALAHASAQVTGMLATPTNDAESTDPLLRAAMTYLSSFHSAHPEQGCPVAALGPELIRAGLNFRRELAAEIRNRLNQLHDLTPPQLSPKIRRRQIAGALACMVGGVILARGLQESEKRKFLEGCHGFLRDALANSGRQRATPKRGATKRSKTATARRPDKGARS
jgi:TetR/AcrR family transcriptional regulator, transcriptional repressor for nem operon